MVVTGRAALLVALGVPVVALWPRHGTWIAWLVLVVLACLVDARLAADPRRLVVRRRVPASVRLTEPATSELTLTNTSGRRLTGTVRDAWQPSAGATENRHQVNLPGGESVRLRTPLLATRRGD